MQDLGDSHSMPGGVGRLNFRDAAWCRIRGEVALTRGKFWIKGKSRHLKNHVFDGSSSWIASYLSVICVSPIFCVILTNDVPRDETCARIICSEKRSEKDNW